MRLEFTNEMIGFLEFSSRESIISQILLQSNPSNIKPIGNFIAASGPDSISYIALGKIEKVDDVWSQKRTPIKVGRFIRRFFTDFAFLNFSISDKDVERFVNFYKSYFTQDESKLKVIEGEELRRYYLQETYHKSNGHCYGSLWNSCMRQRERNKFLELYELNTEEVKMLVYFSDDGKIRARALLWQNVKQHGSDKTYKVMDRIYTVYDHDIDFFKDWAVKNGYISKTIQSAKSELLFTIDGKIDQLSLYVILPKHLLSYAPYLDTFKFYNPRLGRFSNSDRFNHSYMLVQSDGSYEREPEPDPDYYYDDEN